MTFVPLCFSSIIPSQAIQPCSQFKVYTFVPITVCLTKRSFIVHLISSGKDCEIVQLAAVSGFHSLNLYIIPRCQMQRGAAKVTGFRVRRKRLYLHHQPVLTNSLREVLVSFIAFLKMLGRPLVVGHNIQRFDCPLLARALDEQDLRAEFESLVSGYVDTLPLAREMLKDRCLQSFRQENLVRELLGVNYKAHDALEDVRSLQTLFNVLQPTPDLISRHMFTLQVRRAATVNCQRTLWQHFRQAVKVSECKVEEHDII